MKHDDARYVHRPVGVREAPSRQLDAVDKCCALNFGNILLV